MGNLFETILQGKFCNWTKTKFETLHKWISSHDVNNGTIYLSFFAKKKI